jgi:uncharacterized cysteine cluster protein YcgN (CxxCxxCC family)
VEEDKINKKILNKDLIASNFWQKKSLDELNEAEWEALCDGCGKCCLEKIEYIDTNELFTTSVACRLLDTKTCQCSNYKERFSYVDDCIKLNKVNIKTIPWLPKTCAYRLVFEGKDLYDWHPLKSGDKDSTIKSGNSVSNKVIHPKLMKKTIEDYIIYNEEEFFSVKNKES